MRRDEIKAVREAIEYINHMEKDREVAQRRILGTSYVQKSDQILSNIITVKCCVHVSYCK